MSAISIPLTVGLALAGFAFGLAYFAVLRRAVDLFAHGRGWAAPLLLTAVRIASAVAVLVLAVRLGGAVGLLATFAGFLAARMVMMRLNRGEG